jgi:hypothetical protein
MGTPEQPGTSKEMAYYLWRHLCISHVSGKLLF